VATDVFPIVKQC